MSTVIRVEYPREINSATKLCVAAPLVDNMPQGMFSNTDRIQLMLANLSVENFKPITNVCLSEWLQTWPLPSHQGGDVFVHTLFPVLRQLKIVGLDKDLFAKLHRNLVSSRDVYVFTYDTDRRIVNRARQSLHDALLHSYVKLYAEGSSSSQDINDACEI